MLAAGQMVKFHSFECKFRKRQKDIYICIYAYKNFAFVCIKPTARIQERKKKKKNYVNLCWIGKGMNKN